jgi:hypothetical protein
MGKLLKSNILQTVNVENYTIMLATLNNERLLLRDIKKFSQEKSMVQNNRNFQKTLLFKAIDLLAKIAIVNIELYRALNNLNTQIKNDYNYFLKADHETKENLLIKWEKLIRVLNAHSKNKPANTSFLTSGIVNKTTKIIEKVNTFSEQMKTQLYPDINKEYSQEYLKEASEKFKHLPQDVLDDLTSDEYLEYV